MFTNKQYCSKLNIIISVHIFEVYCIKVLDYENSKYDAFYKNCFIMISASCIIILYSDIE